MANEVTREVKRRLATRCLMCAAPLTDAVSVEVGIGPTCRKRAGLDDKTFTGRTEANEATARAAVFAEEGNVEGVLEIAALLLPLFPLLAEKIRTRFIAIRVRVWEGAYLVQTPYSDRFIQRTFELRLGRWNKEQKGREVALDRKVELWRLLRECFPGQQGMGPDGKMFTLPPIAHGLTVVPRETAPRETDADEGAARG